MNEKSLSWGGWIGVIVGVIAAVGVVAGAGYTVGRDTVGSELENVKNLYETCTVSKGSEAIMESLERLRSANENLFKFEEHAVEVDQLNQQISAQEARLGDMQGLIPRLENELAQANAELEEARLILEQENSIEEMFSLTEATAETFLDGEVVVGLVNIFSTFVATNIANKSVNLSVGRSFYFDHNLASCRVTYIGRFDDGNTANFSIVCSQT
jgi:predicted nuclease with TOPRIM domain